MTTKDLLHKPNWFMFKIITTNVFFFFFFQNVYQLCYSTLSSTWFYLMKYFAASGPQSTTKVWKTSLFFFFFFSFSLCLKMNKTKIKQLNQVLARNCDSTAVLMAFPHSKALTMETPSVSIFLQNTSPYDCTVFLIIWCFFNLFILRLQLCGASFISMSSEPIQKETYQ